MSPILFAFVCALTFSLSSSQFNSFRSLICKDSLCEMCSTQRLNKNWCGFCPCPVRNQELCRNQKCGNGRVCKIVESPGWFRQSYATCVSEESTKTTAATTTTTSATTTTAPSTPPSNGRQCTSRADCELGEVCQTSVDQEFGTCTSVRARSPKCLEELRSGPCRAGFRKFFFNTSTTKCEAFFYGGCNPSKNNFDSMAECVKECESTEEEDPCTLKLDTGVCRAIFENYFYNATAGTCEPFQYGGCGGNANRFNSMQACEERCVNNA